MNRILRRSFVPALLGLGAILPGCTPPANTPPAVVNAANVAGQLFCGIQMAGGGTIVVGLIDAYASARLGPAGAVAVVATDMGKAYVDAACVQAAKNANGAAGIPVSPPANPQSVPTVAVVVPAKE